MSIPHEQKELPVSRGYLNDDFLLFHLKDNNGEQYEYHYHDFYKIIFFITGKVIYLIEGKSYILKPWDILLITNRDIHKAIIEKSEPYERIVIWFKPGYFKASNDSDSSLLSFFDKASSEKQSLLRLSPEEMNLVKSSLFELESSFKSNSFGVNTERSSLFNLLIVYLNRIFLQTNRIFNFYKTQPDDTIEKIINYINGNIHQDLSVQSLSEKFYLSRYTLMHKFKKQTGFTIHSFILQKRLLLAGVQIKNGCPATEASYECGFDDYSSFVRAFKKFYGVTPREYQKSQK